MNGTSLGDGLSGTRRCCGLRLALGGATHRGACLSRTTFTACLLFSLVACTTASTQHPPVSLSVDTEGEVRFTALGHGVWLHSSHRDIAPWGLVVSHGLVVTRGTSALLVDTAWDDAQTMSILAWARRSGHPIEAAVMTHAHDDKMGGVGALRKAGVKTFAHPMSNELAPTRDLVPAEFPLSFDAQGLATSPDLPGLTVLFPGAGHTLDNIVVAIDNTPILFGGCLIRPAASDNLGNTADGDIAAWATTTHKVATTFPSSTLIIPSHGDPGDRSLLTHTESLARPRQ